MKEKKTSARSTTASERRYEGFSKEERAAMREAVREQKRSQTEADRERDALEKIAEMQDADRVIAERVHTLIKSSVPGISATTWYGMPAYARDGATICFFKPAQKFRVRYATLGFSDKAKLDEGDMWATEFAVTKLTPAVETRISELVKKAVS